MLPAAGGHAAGAGGVGETLVGRRFAATAWCLAPGSPSDGRHAAWSGIWPQAVYITAAGGLVDARGTGGLWSMTSGPRGWQDWVWGLGRRLLVLCMPCVSQEHPGILAGDPGLASLMPPAPLQHRCSVLSWTEGGWETSLHLQWNRLVLRLCVRPPRCVGTCRHLPRWRTNPGVGGGVLGQLDHAK